MQAKSRLSAGCQHLSDVKKRCPDRFFSVGGFPNSGIFVKGIEKPSQSFPVIEPGRGIKV
jgi:hypothetical protein